VKPLSDNKRAIIDHRGSTEELGYAVAAEEVLVGPPPFGGVRVAAAFGPRVFIVDLADRDYAYLGELDDSCRLSRRIEHRETLARFRDRLGGVLKDLQQPGQCGLSAGNYGRNPAVSFWPRKGKLERGQFSGVHKWNILLASAMHSEAARQALCRVFVLFARWLAW
jgi:hypothetical protein